jgi:hypothetical protein
MGYLMRNRAKCKLCFSIIESFHATDWVQCKCEEIAVGGGEAMRCAAKHWENFFRVDDEGNEIKVKITKPILDSLVEQVSNDPDNASDNNAHNNASQIKPHDKPTKKDLLEMLRNMLQSYESLPQNALNAPITGYDFTSLLILLVALFKEDNDCKEEI